MHRREQRLLPGDPPPPPRLPPFLVVAYINDDGIDGFSERDTLIAGIFDANGDGVVSVGDQIRTDQYPLDVDASSRRPFGKTAHAVTSVISVTPVEVQVGTALSEMLEWINGAPGKYEAFSESGKGGLSTFWDCWGCSQDELSVDVLSPSTPSTPTVDSAAASGGDHVFLDVDILVS